MYRQVGRALAVVATVGVVVSGCGSGPSQVGSAVIVGSTSVPLEQVQSRLDVALGKTDAVAQLASSGVGAPDIARDVVTGAVMHDLLARTAAAEGITVSEADVDAALQESGGADAALSQSLYDLSAIRERVRDRIIAVRHAQRIVPGLTITADLVAAELARRRGGQGPRARRRRPGGRRAVRREPRDLAAQHVLPGGPQPRGGVDRAVRPARRAYRLLPAQPAAGRGWIVLRVTDRREDPNADPNAAASLGESDLAAIGERLLQPLSEEVGVRVNPRFGVWDPVSMRVVAADQQGGAILPLMG